MGFLPQPILWTGPVFAINNYYLPHSNAPLRSAVQARCAASYSHFLKTGTNLSSLVDRNKPVRTIARAVFPAHRATSRKRQCHRMLNKVKRFVPQHILRR